MIAIKLKKSDKKDIQTAFTLISQIGINIAVTIFISLMIGKFLDEKLGTSPWLLITFIVLGVIASFRNLYVLAMKNFNDFK